MHLAATTLPRRSSPPRGFTLIEIMIVIAIMAIIMAVGVPSTFRALTRDDLQRAVTDTIEGCKTARDRAILQAVPYEFVITESGDLQVRQAPIERPARAAFGQPSTEGATIPAGPYSGFPRKLGEDVMIQMIDVNFKNHMELPEARVRFFPNGTCDEFTVVFAWHGKQRTVMTDIVTGLANEFIKQ